MLRHMDGGITYECHPLVDALYPDPSLFCGCDVAYTGVGTEKVMMYHHQMYKGRILALEPPDSLDAVLELAVQSLVQVVAIELLLQVNVPDMGKPKALPAPERLCGSRAKHLQSVSYQYPWGYSCLGSCSCKHRIGIKVHLCVGYLIGKYGPAKDVHHCKEPSLLAPDSQIDLIAVPPVSCPRTYGFGVLTHHVRSPCSICVSCTDAP